MVFAALCVAIGLALPQAFHAVPMGGQIFLPMHLPVLLCGLLCGWYWGALSGIVTPVLSHLFFAMPPAVKLPGMLFELLVYGLVAGLLYRKFRLNIMVALGGAMLAGRAVSGITNALIFLGGGEPYSFGAFLTASFAKALPGILIQLVLLPVLVLALEKGRVVQSPRKNAVGYCAKGLCAPKRR